MTTFNCGATIFVDQKIFIIQTSDGNWLGVISRDLTERNQLQREAREERDFALQVINTVGQGLAVTDEGGNYLLVNPAFANLIGYEAGELIGKNPQGVITVAADEPVLDQAHEDRRRGKTTTYSATLLHKKGRHIPVLITGSPRVKNGEIAGTIASITDITRVKRAEAEREELIKNLEAQNSEMERFTYTVSHDLRSPLVTIKGFLHYLEQDLAAGNQARLHSDMRRIANAVEKMQALLNDLLELSRIGRVMNAPEDISFTEIVQDALGIVHGRLAARRVTVQISLSQSNPPTVHGDRQRLTEVLQNLIDNAAKYMGDQPDPRIEIGQRGEEAGHQIFFVKDNGIGIAPEFHERIFGLFNKLDTGSEGTGVGLALVQRIVEVHGGRLWVESEAGRGSTFYFTLPTK
ncbi:MAG: Adaptive-response sensory-kinase SasA [Anaerolineales bacterium]|nr:Adaptive-response sensory-kinase SasA [Anaerolineales bacterium]